MELAREIKYDQLLTDCCRYKSVDGLLIGKDDLESG